MTQRNDHTLQTRLFFWLDRAIKSCFVSLIALSLVFGNVSGFGNRLQCQDYSSGSLSDFIVVDHHLHHSPLSSAPACEETETSRLAESENDTDDELSKLGHIQSFDAGSNLHSGKSLFLQLRMASEGRSKISLIILHHSWKSFLL